jgi:hypothetical protein
MTMPVRRAFATLLTALSIAGCAAASPTPTEAPQRSSPPATAAATVVPSADPAPSAAAASGPARLEGAAFAIVPGTYAYDLAAPAVTLAVPDGWLMTETFPRHFGLRPTGLPSENSLRTWYDMRVASRDPACPEAPDPAFGHTAADLLAAFTSRPGIVATAPEPVVIGGLAGHVIDVRLDEAWTEACPFTVGLPAATLFVDGDVPDENAFWGLGGTDERMRIYVLDDGAGSSVLITVDAVDATTLDVLVDAAEPVLASYDFLAR